MIAKQYQHSFFNQYVGCRDCGRPLITYQDAHWHTCRLCNECLERRPQRLNKDGTTSYLTARIYPANWRALPPWCDEVVDGKRKTWPIYAYDEQGQVWEAIPGSNTTGEPQYKKWN